MNKFKGIDPDGIMLLAENRFNDSKIFYDAHKAEIKNKVILPLYDLISDLTPLLSKTDDKMNLIPSKMVSRVRRDTRFSKDKMMYRENLWIMFMRNKHEWKYLQPCMWFEFTPAGYNYGVGLFNCEPKVMQCFRKHLDEKGEEFLKAVKPIEKIKIKPSFERYKKDRSMGKDERLKLYYNAKEIYFISEPKPLQGLFDGTCVEEIKEAIKAFTPMYNFLLGITEELINEA